MKTLVEEIEEQMNTDMSLEEMTAAFNRKMPEMLEQHQLVHLVEKQK